MNRIFGWRSSVVMLLPLFLAGCIGNLIQNNDERYMYRGALDAGLPRVYDTYQFNFLRTYRVTHQWPRDSDHCIAYSKLPTLGVKDGNSGEFYNVLEIYEDGGKTWQGGLGKQPPADFDHAVRSIKRMYPEYAVETDRAGNRYTTNKIVAMREREDGMVPVCYNTWSGTFHLLSFSLLKRTVNEWREYINQSLPGGTWSSVQIQGRNWFLYTLPLRPRASGNMYSGPYQLWITSVGNSDYSIGIKLGATMESLQFPHAHAKFKEAAQHLLESVRIEPLKSVQ